LCPNTRAQTFQLHDLAVIDKKIRVCAIVRLLKGEKLREEMGQKARETVREKFLLTRYVEQYLDFFSVFDKNSSLQE
jgi:glycosyltransferase involved in cell wall biosynthesis